MTRLALLGAAHIHTPNFIRMLGARPDHRTVAVWDHDHTRAEKAANQLGAPVCGSVEEALVLADAAIICAETVRHEALVSATASARKHVFVEKPLGMTADDSARMQRAIERAGIVFQTGFFMRGQAIPRYLGGLLSSRAFGRVTRVRASNCHAGSLKGWFDTDWRWMAEPALAGVGAFGDLGAHVLDLLIWWFGRVESATAAIGVATGRYGACDEYGEALLRFGNGVIATLAAGWVDVANPVTLVISGTEGHASVVNGQLYLVGEKLGDGKTPVVDLPAALPHAFDQFLDALAGKPAELVPIADAAHASAVMAQMYRGALRA